MHERSLSSLAAKGKAKESVQWHHGWWDFSHSLEETRRPVQWSKSSVIFTAHEFQPVVLGRHFPSSRQFVLPSPTQIMSALSTYEPPSVISVSPTDNWIFAYFPGRGVDGLGCLWSKEGPLDNWVVSECWAFALGDGVVTAAWTSSHREWTVSETGTSSRLPPLGPITPLATPLLLLVTHAHEIHVCQLPPFSTTLKIVRASLLQPHAPEPVGSPPANDSPGRIGGDRICVKAAIGLSYRGSTILVAMRSRLLPSQSSSHLQNPLDLGLSLDMSQPPPPESPFLAEWELWGEESTISLCEVLLVYRIMIPPLRTRPLPPIYHPNARLADLTFFCPTPPHINLPPPTGTKPEMKPPGAGVHNLYLVASFLDTGDYTSLPKSEIVSYAFVGREMPSAPGSLSWILKGQTQRSSDTKIPCFLLPSVSRGGLLTGFLDARGLLPRRKQKSKEATTGAIEVLKLPELTASEDWDSVPIRSHVEYGNVDVPVSVALSPNEALLTCLSSHLVGAHTSVQALPRRVSGGLASITATHLHGDLARQLVGAIRSRNSPSDVVHALSMPTIPLEVAVNTLYNTFANMESDSNGLVEMWISELLGVATEVYSSRARRMDRGAEKDLCALRWQTALEIASLKACCAAFSSCQEGNAYDLDAVWQLVGLSGWIIELVERLFKECILIGDTPVAAPSTPKPSTPKERDIPDGKALPPIFLLLVHPYALSRLQTALAHVKRFRDQVAKLTAKGENSHIAKDVLMDITDCSGVDLQPLGPLMTEILQDAKRLDGPFLCSFC
ncbi:uncharacterized protein TRAVEDRAFT_120124 [Trametes versicolor FP-101664 SS1]|uniref:uncharacterized protein n=1 Tax=Trametes versicolor (strain FP-101664) TaxID=717944 RepID=UPI00046237E8|nr:uncharacterized protein TRAVEDRAFT_120124 [Trametes versicolor FP-101664 SS1]EIW60130.1 hypothetical protein TRAVEDRAFT_120124 [Trametes versicolor FP-101664 SS1]